MGCRRLGGGAADHPYLRNWTFAGRSIPASAYPGDRSDTGSCRRYSGAPSVDSVLFAGRRGRDPHHHGELWNFPVHLPGMGVRVETGMEPGFGQKRRQKLSRARAGLALGMVVGCDLSRMAIGCQHSHVLFPPALAVVRMVGRVRASVSVVAVPTDCRTQWQHRPRSLRVAAGLVWLDSADGSAGGHAPSWLGAIEAAGANALPAPNLPLPLSADGRTHREIRPGQAPLPLDPVFRAAGFRNVVCTRPDVSSD